MQISTKELHQLVLMGFLSNIDNPLALTFGLLGNLVSFFVYLAPLPTFIRVYKKKSTEGFQSIPYVVALFSAMLWMYYGLTKDNGGAMLITINSIGCTIESFYIIMFLIYAPKPAKLYTIKLLLLLNVGVYGLIILCTQFFTHGPMRVTVLGWICAAFAVSVFAAPLSIMRLVIRTKSVEFMPVSLSFFLTLCSVMWFFYGLLLKDFYIAGPNILGFSFGMAQMTLYYIYRNAKRDAVVPEVRLPEIVRDIAADDLKTRSWKPADNHYGRQQESTERSNQIICDIPAIPVPVPVPVLVPTAHNGECNV